MKKILVSARACLPHEPGVYVFFDAAGALMYVGKATSLQSRVASYFRGTHDTYMRAIERAAHSIKKIGYIITPTVLEAIFLEARLIKKLQPPYNMAQKDDKSFVWVVLTRDEYPRVLVVREKELGGLGGHALKSDVSKLYARVWGPFLSAHTVRCALNLTRTFIPWSECVPGKKRPCFYAEIQKCPGVCVRALSPRAYARIIARLILFLDGKRTSLEKILMREMKRAAAQHHFEDAAVVRNQLWALQHIADVALIGAVENENTSDRALPPAFTRIEGYDISHFAGTNMVGSMVVFENGVPQKSEYRKFSVRGFTASNDTGALGEVLTRRRAHTEWPTPTLIFVDGGEAQVNAARRVCDAHIPVVGIAKGPTRKNVRFVYDKKDAALNRLVRLYPHIFVRVRDEAHRFAITFQRSKRKYI